MAQVLAAAAARVIVGGVGEAVERRGVGIVEGEEVGGGKRGLEVGDVGQGYRAVLAPHVALEAVQQVELIQARETAAQFLRAFVQVERRAGCSARCDRSAGRGIRRAERRRLEDRRPGRTPVCRAGVRATSRQRGHVGGRAPVLRLARRPAPADRGRDRRGDAGGRGEGDGPVSVEMPARFAAIPAEGNDFIYISSGTWSLIGIESHEPIINADSLKYNLTNEGGVCDTIRFLKNIMGMWLLQECRRQWAKAGKNYSYDELTNLAAQAPGLKSFVYVGDNRFLPPGDMVERIQSFCRETQQLVPQSHAEIVRCILESLSLEYRWTTEKLRELSGKGLAVIHNIGGGSRNRLLNQFTADATGCPVIAGPVEATAIGNVLMQAIGLGHLSSLSGGRALVRRSFGVTSYEPRISPAWDEAYSRYLTLRK